MVVRNYKDRVQNMLNPEEESTKRQKLFAEDMNKRMSEIDKAKLLIAIKSVYQLGNSSVRYFQTVNHPHPTRILIVLSHRQGSFETKVKRGHGYQDDDWKYKQALDLYTDFIEDEILEMTSDIEAIPDDDENDED